MRGRQRRKYDSISTERARLTCLLRSALEVSPSTGCTPQPASLIGLPPGNLDLSAPGESSRGLSGVYSGSLQLSTARQLRKFR